MNRYLEAAALAACTLAGLLGITALFTLVTGDDFWSIFGGAAIAHIILDELTQAERDR